MSFVDLMADHIWSEADIVGRTESILRAVTSEADQAILTRKITAGMLGLWVASEKEKTDIAIYEAACLAAYEAGAAARADMALLQSVLDHENAASRLTMGIPAIAALRLDQPKVTTPATVSGTAANGAETTFPNPAIAIDLAERAEAQAVIDADAEERAAAEAIVAKASPAVLALVALRKPPLDEVGEPAAAQG